LPAGVTLLLFRGEVHRPSHFSRILGWLAAGLMWLWFLYLGSRSRLIMFSMVILACYYLPRRRSPPLLLVVVLFFVLQVSVNFQKNYREQFTHLSFNLANVQTQELWHNILPEFLGGKSELGGADISAGGEFNCALAVVRLVPETVSYNYGYGFLEVFTRLVPRAVWPEKRYPHLESVQGVLRTAELSTTTVVTAQRQELLMGPAFAFTGHWYYVGGLVGLMVGGVLTGVLFRFIRGFLDWSPQNHSVLITYPFLLSIGFSEAATTPGIWIFSLPFVLLPFIFVVYFCREQPAYASRNHTARRRETVPASPQAP